MIYVIMDMDYSSSSIVAVLSGPEGVDVETLFQAWYTKEVLDVIGRAPPDDSEQAYYLAYQARFKELQEKYGAEEKEWNHIFVKILIQEHGFERVVHEDYDFYPGFDW